ncbi:hypothetical protein Vretimale_6460 [Volvox reticuliferus]|nr:hypothetical protein Vretifemale_7417 [Volvox reticuliferus]GIM01726.1 hypothetical protein Vretimale_6460 [Volvox reticuliferus]
MLNETYRPDFDVALPVTRPIFREPSPLVVHLGSLTSMETTEPAQLLQPIMRGRDLLLYFRGCAQRFGTPGMCEDRVNIFADHFPPPVDQPDVVILAICCGNHDGGLKTLSHCRGCYDNVRIENGQSVNCTAGWPDVSFDDGIRRAKFTFTPRGCGPLTYRMLEAIGAGSVPVLTGRGTFIPFAGEGHLGQLWRQCVIHTPEAQLPQLISSLRAMSDAEYHFRLLACAQIAALQSHSIQVTTKQTICIILFRIATLLKRQRNGELPVWLSTAGTALRGELGLPFETTTVPYSRVLIAQCSHVGVPLGHL